jgi:hypothetical protein
MRLSSIRDDLIFLNTGFSGNPLMTDYQKTVYADSIRGGRIDPVQWAKSNKMNLAPLILSAEDGYDGEPVGSIGFITSKKAFLEGEDSILLPIRDIVRAGFFFHIDVFRMLQLAIKREWEAAKIGDRSAGHSDESGGAPAAAVPAFSPRITAIFEAMTNVRSILETNTLTSPTIQAQKELDRITDLCYCDLDEKSFSILSKEIVLNKLHLCTVDSKEMRHFVALKTEEASLLRRASDHDRQLFLMFKSTWIDLEIEHENINREEEETYILSERITEDIMRICGKNFIELSAIEMKMQILEKKIAAKKETPSLTNKRISDMFKHDASELTDRIQHLESIASSMTLDKGSGVRADTQIAPHHGTADPGKDLFLVLEYYLSHTRLESNPHYEDLKPEYKERLAYLWEAVSEIKIKEQKRQIEKAAMSDNTRETLSGILDEAKKLISYTDAYNSIGYYISGNTIKEQMRWLQTWIEKLEREITKAKSEITAFRLDIEAKKKMLAVPAEYEKYSIETKEKIESKTKEHDKLADIFEKLFVN